MPGLRWTARGAVTLPEALQVRLEPLHAGRVAAGAPMPTRALTADELDRNLRWFTSPGPRGRAVSGLVLSGLPDALEPIAEAVATSRAASVRRVVVHVDGAALGRIAGSSLAPLVDAWVVAARSVAEVPDRPVDLVVPLEAAVLPQLSAIARRAAEAGHRRLTLTWPYPAGEALPVPFADAIAAIERVTSVSSLPVNVRGIPPCLLPSRPVEPRRSGNRWYVDAEHQLGSALLFFPDVLQLSKAEVCRFCDLDARCDGVAETWLRANLLPPFVPVRES